MSRILIIAEAGVNHNGSVEQAKQLVRAAADAGVDVVKFQTFVTEACMTPQAEQAEYQTTNTGTRESQYEMVKRLELGWTDFDEIRAECLRCDVTFCSTPFDRFSIDYLAGVGVPFWKIPSGEITNLPYLRKIGALGQSVILSTGMAGLDEVGAALDVLAAAGTPRDRITLLHCTTDYPAAMHDVNLRAMVTLRHTFSDVRGVGYSDHTQGIAIPIAAAALGAIVVEKHFTLDRTLPGPDHLASLEPRELAAMVQAIRHVEEALGDGIKQPAESERRNIPIARKSIVAARSIQVGEIFSEENLAVKRPGSGVSPMRWDEVIGQTATRAYQPDEMIDA
jgi:N,N'-diacetyllegionaminate synthase